MQYATYLHIVYPYRHRIINVWKQTPYPNAANFDDKIINSYDHIIGVTIYI